VLHRPAVAADQNKSIRILLLFARAITLRQQTPWRRKLLLATAGLGFACAAAVRMVYRIARYTTVNWANAAMPRPARFAENDVFVLGIADLADGRVAILVYAADFAGRKSNLSVTFITRHQSRRATGGADHLRAVAG